MVERKRMQLRGPWKWEIMNSSPVSAPCAPGGLPCSRFKGQEGGRWRLFRPAKGIWKLWPTSICLLHIRRHSTFLTFVAVVVLVVRLVAPLLPLPPSPLLSSPLLPSSPAAFCHQAAGKREREEEKKAVESNNKFEGTLFLAPCFLARPKLSFHRLLLLGRRACYICVR